MAEIGQRLPGCEDGQNDAHAHHHHGTSNDVDVQPHQHAFFLLGTRRLFLVHMGNMWMAPHRYQLVLEVSIPEDARQRFLTDRQAHPNDWYIIGNEAANPFALPVIPRGTISTFIGSIWRGFPTQGGTAHWPWAHTPPVAANFQVTIERVVYYRHLDFNLEYPRTATYVLFGAEDEAYLHHFVTRQPDYDHVVSLTHAPAWLPALLLESGVSVNFPRIPAVPAGKVPVYTTNPLSPGEHFVQYGGTETELGIGVGQTVFFGTWPINEKDPAQQ